MINMNNIKPNCPVFRYMDIDRCCGCEVCTNACPVSALSMVADNEGFVYPVLDENKCIGCEKCVKVCPMYNAVPKDNKLERFYVFSHSDNEILVNSSSGGAFSFLYNEIKAKYQGAYVAGAAYSEDCKQILHIVSNMQENFNRMRGSKYFQSTKGEIYDKVKRLLDGNEAVLFTGAPCEVDALYRFLGKDYEKLWTMDYICKGSSTPRMLKEYVEYLNKKMKSEATFLSMRYKWYGIDNFIPQFVKVNFKNGKSFLHEFYNTELGLCFKIVQRKNCPDCPYREKLHPADFTIGDYHEHNTDDPVFNHLGTSVVILNSEKGISIWLEINKDSVKYREIQKDEVYRHNRNPADTRNRLLRSNLQKYDGVTAVRNTIGLKEKIKMVLPVIPLRKITAWRREHKR